MAKRLEHVVLASPTCAITRACWRFRLLVAPSGLLGSSVATWANVCATRGFLSERGWLFPAGDPDFSRVTRRWWLRSGLNGPDGCRLPIFSWEATTPRDRRLPRRATRALDTNYNIYTCIVPRISGKKARICRTLPVQGLCAQLASLAKSDNHFRRIEICTRGHPKVQPTSPSSGGWYSFWLPSRKVPESSEILLERNGVKPRLPFHPRRAGRPAWSPGDTSPKSGEHKSKTCQMGADGGRWWEFRIRASSAGGVLKSAEAPAEFAELLPKPSRKRSKSVKPYRKPF